MPQVPTEGGDLQHLGDRQDGIRGFTKRVVEQTAMGEGGMSRSAHTKANAWGGGTLERGDLRLLEDGSERGGALGSDLVVSETAKGQSEDGGRVSVSTALTQRQTLGLVAHLSEVTALPLSASHSLVMPLVV